MLIILLKIFVFMVASSLWTEGVPDYYRERIVEYRIRREERNCTDYKWAQCHYFVKADLCEVYRRTLRNRCRKSCNLCGNVKTCAFSEFGCCWDMTTPAKGRSGEGCPRNCHNRLGKYRCSILRLTGACEVDRERMGRLCRGVCVCDRGPAMAAPSCSFSKYGCCWNGVTVADENNSKCPVCKDIINRRICRIFRKDCSEYVGIKGWQMRTFCPRTCGICRIYKRRLLKRNSSVFKKSIKQKKVLKTKKFI